MAHLYKDADGNIRTAPDETVYVRDETELADFTGRVPPGTYAIAYGGGAMWRLDVDGEWQEV